MSGTVDFLSIGSLIRQTGILHARQLFECAPRRLVTLRLRSGLRLTGSVALRLVGARMTIKEYWCIFCHSRVAAAPGIPIRLPPDQKSTVWSRGRNQLRSLILKFVPGLAGCGKRPSAPCFPSL